MLDVQTIRTDIIRALNNYTGRLVIRKDTTAKAPEYPFIGVKFIILGQKVGRERKQLQLDQLTHEQDIELSLSVATYSDKIGDAEVLAYKALQFFETEARDVLQHVTVVQTSDLTDRTTFLTMGYEYSIGFDVRLRAVAQATKTVQLIETVLPKKKED